MIEVEVHSSLKKFLRTQGHPHWPHHLTMARLVARALRLNRSGVIQTGSTWEQYCLSYLTPALLWQGGVVIVVPESMQGTLVEQTIPQLQQWLQTQKKICLETEKSLSEEVDSSFSGIFLTSPQNWLQAHLDPAVSEWFSLPTLIDRGDQLEEWTRDYLTRSWRPQDWEELRQRYPGEENFIRDLRIQLTKTIFSHPPNPYNCYLLESLERKRLQTLLHHLQPSGLLWQNIQQSLEENQPLIWASVQRDMGQFTLHFAPVTITSHLRPIWQHQTVVVMGGFLDGENKASIYRQQVGLGDVTCLKFAPNRHHEDLKLYLPPRFPLPNTPEFHRALLHHLQILVSLSRQFAQSVVIIVDDTPLKAQVGTTIAAEHGSQVQVEPLSQEFSGIVISGWDFWHQHHSQFPTPQLLVIATLPIPSLEDPLVAARVADHKRQRQNWFQLYLLPTALRKLQEAIMPVRESQGIVAVLDNRVSYRSYGKTILASLEPFARMNYIDASWFEG